MLITRSPGRTLAVVALAALIAACGQRDPAPGGHVDAARKAAKGPVEASLPVSEATGLAVRARAKATLVLAVGDASGDLVVVPLSELTAPKTVLHVPLGLPGTARADLEAVATDNEGRVYVLEGRASRVRVFELPGDTTAKLVHTYHLDVPLGHPLAEVWSRDPDARGEGLLVAPNGRLLVAKQNEPLALIEFGAADQGARGIAPGSDVPGAQPSGAESHLAPLAFWILDADQADEHGIGSLTDMSRHPDGGLYLAGATGWIARVKLPLSPKETGFRLTRLWRVPGGGKRTRRVEALAITADGHALVGFDHKGRAPNVMLLPLE